MSHVENTVQGLMAKAQEFASTWAVVDGPFDDGGAMQRANESKAQLEAMIVAALHTSATSLKALHALILDGELHDAERLCDQLLAQQEQMVQAESVAALPWPRAEVDDLLERLVSSHISSFIAGERGSNKPEAREFVKSALVEAAGFIRAVLQPLHPAEGVPAPMPVPHPHHCTARTADGSCEECEGHAQAMAEWNAERSNLAATHPTQQGLDAIAALEALVRDADSEPDGDYLDGAGKNRVAVHRKGIELARAIAAKAKQGGA